MLPCHAPPLCLRPPSSNPPQGWTRSPSSSRGCTTPASPRGLTGSGGSAACTHRPRCVAGPGTVAVMLAMKRCPRCPCMPTVCATITPQLSRPLPPPLHFMFPRPHPRSAAHQHPYASCCGTRGRRFAAARPSWHGCMRRPGCTRGLAAPAGASVQSTASPSAWCALLGGVVTACACRCAVIAR